MAMTKTDEPGPFRRIWRNRPLRFTLIGLTCLVLPVGCIGVLNAVSGECLRPNIKVSETVLPGTYRGPDGMRVSLYPNGDIQVRNWPYDPFEVDGRHFDGQGSWAYQLGTTVPSEEKYPYVALNFDESASEGDAPAEDQKLMVGGSSEDPVLFEQDDPDGCPDAEFRQ